MTSTAVKNVMVNRPPRSATELTDAEVEAFSSNEFVKQAVSHANKPEHVLSFFFGEDFDDEHASEAMRSGACLKRMSKFWFQENEKYDNLCASFSDLIRAAGKKSLKGSHWNNHVDGGVAQLILCDQLSRNAFRGTSEAFAYDEVAQQIARDFALNLVSAAQTVPEIPSMGPKIDGLDGEVFPSYIAFILVALMHSESLDDHDLCDQLFQRAIETSQPHLHVYFEGEQKVEQEHRQILELFGRYPYRNAVLGRATTPEEAEWLAKTKVLFGKKVNLQSGGSIAT